ncbi:MAG: hypothetical protein ACLTZT_07310 [Butyricimonas faecalis]
MISKDGMSILIFEHVVPPAEKNTRICRCWKKLPGTNISFVILRSDEAKWKQTLKDENGWNTVHTGGDEDLNAFRVKEFSFYIDQSKDALRMLI